MSYRTMELVGVTVDTQGIQDALAEINDKISEIESLTEDRVEALIEDTLSNKDYQDSEDVSNAIDSALADYTPDDLLDEDDVRRIADEAISEADDADLKDLERRLDLYAQKVDAAIRDAHTLRMKVESLENASQDAITFMGLLRRAAEVLLGRN